MLPKTNAPMKATKSVSAKAMTKSRIAKMLAAEYSLKQKTCTKMLNALANVGSIEVKKTGVFAVPGLCRIKTRTKPATKAGERNMFGKVVLVKAQPAKKNIESVSPRIGETKYLMVSFVAISLNTDRI